MSTMLPAASLLSKNRDFADRKQLVHNDENAIWNDVCGAGRIVWTVGASSSKHPRATAGSWLHCVTLSYPGCSYCRHSMQRLLRAASWRESFFLKMHVTSLSHHHPIRHTFVFQGWLSASNGDWVLRKFYHRWSPPSPIFLFSPSRRKQRKRSPFPRGTMSLNKHHYHVLKVKERCEKLCLYNGRPVCVH